MSFGYAASGLGAVQWPASCTINQNQASLTSWYYVRGNGQTNFALPDLRARVPMHRRQRTHAGERGGEQGAPRFPSRSFRQHTHALNATSTQAGRIRMGPTPSEVLAQSNFSFGYTTNAGNLAAF